ncbi:aromatic-ring hydroxylase C-terminal domain-containing protein [Acidomonas methanolica]|uniref:aromatic-ring hydroxylase C-terminal domain-containing protein n=1 Tax=Acidomonas methanolica TaxID=437 RepID=UPI00351D2542
MNAVSSSAEDRFGLGTVLVRPDGFVAWAMDSAKNDEGFREAATRWFGAPEVSVEETR